MRKLAVACVFFAATLRGQQFEVASVKVAGASSVRDSGGGPGSRDAGRYHYHSANMDDLIATAYDVDYFQITGPRALDKERYDVDVNVPEGTTKEQFRAMMRNLLAERFHLKCRVETKEFPAYELVVAKGGPKLDTAGASVTPKAWVSDGFPEMPKDRPGMISRHTVSNGFILIRMRGRQEPLSAIADGLQPPDHRPVVDKTGLTGRFDFTLEYAQDLPSGAGGDAPPAPSIFTALQQQLGLQLVEKKMPFPAVIVESVDKIPTEN